MSFASEAMTRIGCGETVVLIDSFSMTYGTSLRSRLLRSHAPTDPSRNVAALSSMFTNSTFMLTVIVRFLLSALNA